VKYRAELPKEPDEKVKQEQEKQYTDEMRRQFSDRMFAPSMQSTPQPTFEEIKKSPPPPAKHFPVGGHPGMNILPGGMRGTPKR
jgi:hypothetical protein